MEPQNVTAKLGGVGGGGGGGTQLQRIKHTQFIHRAWKTVHY